ncbi:MAG TPA: mycothiol synthase [Acidimicrobiales bacterium]|nr:mycothiol synthase [Acidimicrobiales bacterium]
MPAVEIDTRRGALSPDEHIEVIDLLLEVAAADGHPALSEAKGRDLVADGGDGFVALLARRPGEANLVGYAQLHRRPATWGLEIVRHPAARTTELLAALLERALTLARAGGGGPLHYWVSRPTAETDAVAAQAHLLQVRDLLELHVPLPLPDDVRATARPVEVRPFRPGADEAAWLEVNNRAFAGHPEQGGWAMEDVVAREHEPWFDPAGFLLHEEGGRLVGSCWTKAHRDVEPPRGEIYVISVDPAAHQRGLGRSLTVAGLDWLAGDGLPVGMLYVDASNKAAVALYDSLGFVVDHVDRAYVTDLS